MPKFSRFRKRIGKAIFIIAVIIVAFYVGSLFIDLKSTVETPGAGPSWVQKYQDHVGSETDTSPPAWGMWWRYLTLLIIPAAFVAGIALLFLGVVWDMYFGPATKKYEEKTKKTKK